MKKSLLGISTIALTIGFVGSLNAEGMMNKMISTMPSMDKPNTSASINKFKEKLGVSNNKDKSDAAEDSEKNDDANEAEDSEKNDDGDADDMPKKKSILDYFKK